MKKLIALILALTMLLIFAGCKNVEVEDQTDATTVLDTIVAQEKSKRDNIPFEEGQLYAVAYMGYQQMKPIERYSEYLDDLDLPIYSISEGDFYLVIPRFNNTDLKLYKIDTGTGEKTLFKEVKNSGAFVVQCNISDIVNDVSIELISADEKTEFSPFISLKDGSLQIGKRGLNITVEK